MLIGPHRSFQTPATTKIHELAHETNMLMLNHCDGMQHKYERRAENCVKCIPKQNAAAREDAFCCLSVLRRVTKKLQK